MSESRLSCRLIYQPSREPRLPRWLLRVWYWF